MMIIQDSGIRKMRVTSGTQENGDGRGQDRGQRTVVLDWRMDGQTDIKRYVGGFDYLRLDGTFIDVHTFSILMNTDNTNSKYALNLI